jgi:hypothetical protein
MILSLLGFFVSSQSTTIDITESFQPVIDMIGIIAPIAYALIPALIGFGILSIIGGFVAMVVGIFTVLPKVFDISVGFKKK